MNVSEELRDLINAARIPGTGGHHGLETVEDCVRRLCGFPERTKILNTEGNDND